LESLVPGADRQLQLARSISEVSMKETHLRLLKQVVDMALEGKFGELIKSTQREYEQLPPGMVILIKTVLDFYEETAQHHDAFAEIRSLVFQLLIVAFREAKQKNPDVAMTFLYSFLEDYPGVPESSLLSRWSSLANASLAFREVADSKQRLLIWQQASKQFQAYNEFLNGLLSYLIILWRTSLGRLINPAVFDIAYGSKVDEFRSLTGGENGAFSVLLTLARPRVRNAIAHETLWLDSDAGKVRFTEGRNPRTEYEMDLVEFMGLAAVGSHLAHSYIAAIGAIAVMELGNDLAKSLLPPQLVRLFNHTHASA
jgi:hypothetical protein